MPRYKSLPKTKQKRTNEFVSAVDHAVRFLAEYKRTFLMSLVVVVLGGLSYLILQQKRENDLENLNQLVFKASGAKEGQAGAFQKVFEKYGRYPLAQSARLFLVDEYLKKGESEKALEELTQAVEKGPTLLTPWLKLGRAELLWQMGRGDEALEYIESVETESPITGTDPDRGGLPAWGAIGYFLLLKGQILESLDKKEEARGVYQGLLDSAVDDPFLRKKVQIRLVSLEGISKSH